MDNGKIIFVGKQNGNYADQRSSFNTIHFSLRWKCPAEDSESSVLSEWKYNFRLIAQFLIGELRDFFFGGYAVKTKDSNVSCSDCCEVADINYNSEPSINQGWFRRYAAYLDSGSKRQLHRFLRYARLANVNNEQAECSDRDRPFRNLFPAGSIVCALIGLACSYWGWSSLRDNRRVNLATTAFFSGVILWGYGFATILVWSMRF
jgi:hypothetical protein